MFSCLWSEGEDADRLADEENVNDEHADDQNADAGRNCRVARHLDTRGARVGRSRARIEAANATVSRLVAMSSPSLAAQCRESLATTRDLKALRTRKIPCAVE